MHRKLPSLALAAVLALGYIGAGAPPAQATVYELTCTIPSGVDNCWTDYSSWSTTPWQTVAYDILVDNCPSNTAKMSVNVYVGITLPLHLDIGATDPGFGIPFDGGPHVGTFATSDYTGPPIAGLAMTGYSGHEATGCRIRAHFEPLSFNGPCATNVVTNHYTTNKVTTGNTKQNGVEGFAYARDLYPCDLVVGNQPGFSMVLPASLQQSALGGASIVQLGYGKRSGDPWMDFWYTATDNLNGALTNVDWFVGPTVGHSYSFTITAKKVGPNNFWHYCINDWTNLTSGCHDTAATWTYGYMSWWGYETKNVNDALGVRYGDVGAPIAGLRYRLTNGTWTQVLSPVCIARDTGKSYYHCDQAAGDAINGYTTAH